MVPPASPWRNPRIVGLLALVFLTGAATGALVMRTTSVYAKPKTVNQPIVSTEKEKEKLLEKLNTELNLTPEQSAEIRDVLSEYMTLYMSLQAQMDDMRASGKARVYRVLNEGQRRKFEQIMGASKSR